MPDEDLPLLPFEQGQTTQDPQSALFDLIASEDEGNEESDEQASDDDKSDDVTGDESDDESDDDESDDDDEDSGDEESDDDDDDDEEVKELDPDVYQVKVDGDLVEVTLDELQRGYSRHEDYTRKTQELATERTAIRDAQDGYVQKLEALERVLVESMPAEPDWETLRKENPAEYAAQKEEIRERRTQILSVQAEKAKEQESLQEKRQEQLQEFGVQQFRILVEKVPEWSDDVIAKAEMSELVEFAQHEYGWTQEELDSVYDHRMILLLRDAQAGQKVKTSANIVAKKKKAAPVLKPGARKPEPTKKTRSRKAHNRRIKHARETGGKREATDAILGLLQDDLL